MKITMAGKPLNLIGNEKNIGDIAYSFIAVKDDLSEFNFNECKGKPIVLTSFPSIDTGICAIQTNLFNQKIGEYKDKASLVIISNDLPFAQKRYCGVNGIDNAIVVSDHKDLDFSMNYGMLIEELRLLARAVFVIDKDFKIVYKEVASEIKTELNYDKALEALKSVL